MATALEPSRIDAHTHAYHGLVSPYTVSDFARQQNESHWATLHCPPKSLQDWPADHQEWIARQQRAGINHSLILGWYWENPSTTLLQNHHLRSSIPLLDPHRTCFASVHPALPARETIADLLKCEAAGFLGIGEIHPTLQGFPLNHPAWEPIFRFASDHSWPVTIHISEPLGRPHPGNLPTPLLPILHLVEAFPDLTVILAHWGGLACFFELNPYIAKRFRRVYYDTAASPLLYSDRIWQSVLQAVAVEKILFGSDFPLRLSRHQNEASTIPLLDQAASNLSPKAFAAITHQNILRTLPSLANRQGTSHPEGFNLPTPTPPDGAEKTPPVSE